MRPVFALAGRRIDPPGAAAGRFPGEHEALVRQRLTAVFAERGPVALVCAAACGADLLALEVAQRLSVPATVVLPWDRPRFRAQSVDDCVGDWGRRFDSLVDAAESAGRLRLMGLDPGDKRAYERTNLAILDAAGGVATAHGSPVIALVVWDGAEKPAGDVTAHFRGEGLRRGFEVVDVPTM